MEQYRILHEDRHLVAVDKLVPIPVQKDRSGDPNLQDLLREELSRRPAGTRHADPVFLEAAHRLDRRVSGVMLFAKTRAALAGLEAAFRSRIVRKTYIACVETEPEPAEGVLEHVLVEVPKINKTIAYPPGSPGRVPAGSRDPGSEGRDDPSRRSPGSRPGKPARLEYRLAGRSERYFFVEVHIDSGGHHQIRAQLAAAGWPVRGDLKYGARRSCASGLVMLHAAAIAFTHPATGERMDIEAPFPELEPLWHAFSLPVDRTDP